MKRKYAKNKDGVSYAELGDIVYKTSKTIERSAKWVMASFDWPYQESYYYNSARDNVKIYNGDIEVVSVNYGLTKNTLRLSYEDGSDEIIKASKKLKVVYL